MHERVQTTNSDPSSLLDRALGAYIGLAIGDALGATVEFMTEREIAVIHKVHREIVGGGWLHLKPGAVTDDTQMALALGSVLEDSRTWNLRGVADAFVAWMKSKPIDIGQTCRRGIRRYITQGTLSAPPSEEDAGNGAAMRNLPVILANLFDEPAMLERSLEQAHVTHNNLQSDAAILTLAKMTRLLLLKGACAPCDAIAQELVLQDPKFIFRPWRGQASGYIVETVQTVFDGFFNSGSFEDCLVRVVNRGGDADTTGAIAGQLAGALYGYSGILYDCRAFLVSASGSNPKSILESRGVRLLEMEGPIENGLAAAFGLQALPASMKRKFTGCNPGTGCGGKAAGCA